MDPIYDYFKKVFEDAVSSSSEEERRVGAELKFPLVSQDGAAASYQTVRELWRYLEDRGWKAYQDPVNGEVVGARKPGEQNDTWASCETGYCKTEFSLAHVADLFDLDRSVKSLRKELQDFCDQHRVFFLGYGIQPLTPPSKWLLMKKGRSGVWDKVFGSNRHICKADGDDFHLFTINAASHVHVSVERQEVIDTVNVLNGFAPAQIALTAHSNIWKGRIDPKYKCVSEKLWDWWMTEPNRVGLPPKPFENLEDYIKTVAELKPVYVKRHGKPIVLEDYESFDQYYSCGRAVGIDAKGRKISFVPEECDIDLHSSCYWYNARISRYFTVENRVCDQQPPGELVCVAALTLGLVSALPEALEELSAYDWQDLRKARESACRHGLEGEACGESMADLSARVMEIAELGLKKRGFGEKAFLEPLKQRLKQKQCPADEAARLFESGGINALLSERRI